MEKIKDKLPEYEQEKDEFIDAIYDGIDGERDFERAKALLKNLNMPEDEKVSIVVEGYIGALRYAPYDIAKFEEAFEITKDTLDSELVQTALRKGLREHFSCQGLLIDGGEDSADFVITGIKNFQSRINEPEDSKEVEDFMISNITEYLNITGRSWSAEDIAKFIEAGLVEPGIVQKIFFDCLDKDGFKFDYNKAAELYRYFNLGEIEECQSAAKEHIPLVDSEYYGLSPIERAEENAYLWDKYINCIVEDSKKADRVFYDSIGEQSPSGKYGLTPQEACELLESRVKQANDEVVRMDRLEGGEYEVAEQFESCLESEDFTLCEEAGFHAQMRETEEEFAEHEQKMRTDPEYARRYEIKEAEEEQKEDEEYAEYEEQKQQERRNNWY